MVSNPADDHVKMCKSDADAVHCPSKICKVGIRISCAGGRPRPNNSADPVFLRLGPRWLAGLLGRLSEVELHQDFPDEVNSGQRDWSGKLCTAEYVIL